VIRFMARPLPPSALDIEFASRADTRPPLLWPVYGFADRYCQKEAVAVFFSWGDAAEYAMRPEERHGWPRNLYMGEPRRRAA
jgi:hypothetical protein